jgi:hypothetical protein
VAKTTRSQESPHIRRSPARMARSMIGAVGDCGLQSTETCQTKARHVYGANRQREPHNNVQDRAQKNLPSNGFASHTPSFCLLWGANTLLLSLGMSPFCCSKSSQGSQFPPELEIRFDCAGSRFLSWGTGEGIAHVGRYSRHSSRSQHRNIDRSRFRRVSVGLSE